MKSDVIAGYFFFFFLPLSQHKNELCSKSFLYVVLKEEFMGSFLHHHNSFFHPELLRNVKLWIIWELPDSGMVSPVFTASCWMMLTSASGRPLPRETYKDSRFKDSINLVSVPSVTSLRLTSLPGVNWHLQYNYNPWILRWAHDVFLISSSVSIWTNKNVPPQQGSPAPLVSFICSILLDLLWLHQDNSLPTLLWQLGGASYSYWRCGTSLHFLAGQEVMSLKAKKQNNIRQPISVSHKQ